ncbi:MAG: hypothetical protein KIS90_15575, partial [Phenylobacterium sp.]|nr:hypothetical protein [Phenylobacterium sp.]
EGKAVYDYIFLDLEAPKGTPPTRPYAERVKARLPAIEAAGGEVLGLFTPQIGWTARQAALLVRWPENARPRESEIQALSAGSGVRAAQRSRLTPTLRPNDAARPEPGGIHVHRWFVVETGDVPEFLQLSGQGWTDFERKFDARIFGLFAAERSAADTREGVQRILLITRYGDHGVWEKSRDPSTEAMAAFRRRSEITRDTWNDSTLLVPIGT